LNGKNRNLYTETVRFIEARVQNSDKNRLTQLNNEKIFEAPLIGVADGYDDLFDAYKTIIGDYHHTPKEIFRLTRSPEKKPVGELSVLCWALPFSRAIKKSNHLKTMAPSLRWCLGTRHGEAFNHFLRQELEIFFQKRGIPAIAPVSSSVWRRIEDLPGGHTSNWSERHALYAAGLGTFSLNDGFITEKGMAMRCGSIIVNTALPITQRTAENHTANCLFLEKGTCGACIDRCPAGAITAKGHDKVLCRRYREIFFGYLKKDCGMDIEPGMCGLCQTHVPCESKNPNRTG
jgi:epoxyqueuosine reductase QueG